MKRDTIETSCEIWTDGKRHCSTRCDFYVEIQDDESDRTIRFCKYFNEVLNKDYSKEMRHLSLFSGAKGAEILRCDLCLAKYRAFPI
jgi:hypothetical protein